MNCLCCGVELLPEEHRERACTECHNLECDCDRGIDIRDHELAMLAAAVISEAIKDALHITPKAQRHNFGCGSRDSQSCQLPKNAMAWILSSGKREVVRSFRWWCAQLDIDPRAVIRQIELAEEDPQLRWEISKGLNTMKITHPRDRKYREQWRESTVA